jgi:hypothetical protein
VTRGRGSGIQRLDREQARVGARPCALGLGHWEPAAAGDNGDDKDSLGADASDARHSLAEGTEERKTLRQVARARSEHGKGK